MYYSHVNSSLCRRPKWMCFSCLSTWQRFTVKQHIPCFFMSHGLTGLKRVVWAALLLEWQLVPFNNPLQNSAQFWKWLWVRCKRKCRHVCADKYWKRNMDHCRYNSIFCLDTGGNQCNILYICMLCSACSTKEIICGSTHGMARCIWIIHSKQRAFPLILRLWSAASINMLTEQELCNGVRRDGQI